LKATTSHAGIQETSIYHFTPNLTKTNEDSD
jgi:hypothetical protein